MVNVTDVLVTGSEGFIGSALVNALLRADHRVRGLDVLEPKSTDIDYEYFQGSIRNFSDIKKALNSVEIVFHLAAISNLNVARTKPLETIETNVMATANLLEVCRQKGVKMIFASSDHVYGTQPGRTLTETTTTAPREIYAASKVAAEEIVRNFSIPNTILRFGTVYGPRMRTELAIHIFLSSALKGEPITIHFPGTQKRQYIFIDDLIEGIMLAMNPQADGQTINLPGNELITVVDLANSCIKLAGSNSKLIFLPPRPSDLDSEFVSFEKAKNLLGWIPKVNLNEGLLRTLHSIRTMKTELGLQEQNELATTSPLVYH